MKIIHVITKSNWGGAQRYVYDIATRLPREKYESEVILGGTGPLFHKLQDAGVKVTSIPELERDMNAKKDWKTFVTLFKYFRKAKPDVIHLNSSKIGGIGALAGRLARVKRIVFTAHGWAFNENRSFASKIAIKWAYWTTLFLAHETIMVSNNMKRGAEGWPFIKEKISVVHNGVVREAGFSKLNARTELMRRSPALKAAVESNRKSLLWIGTIAELHHIKGYEYALKAISSLADKAIYVIIGEGEQRAHIEKLIAELNLEKNVFLLGHIDKAADYISAFDVFMLSSLSEALAYVILEAGQASVPVVATAVGGIPEIIDDMRSGLLVQPKNSRELGHALSFMIEHPSERKRYGTALKEKVTKEFSLEKMVKETEGVYNRATSVQ
jgi:glycosyltransferase involved in cell wall biosynthesis